MIQQGGVKIDGEKVSDRTLKLEAGFTGILQVGKRKFCQRHGRMNRLSDIDWDSWQAKDPATLVFVFRDDEILLINKKTGLGKGKVNGPGR